MFVEFMQYSDADALSKALTDGSLDMAAPVSASTATGLNGKDGPDRQGGGHYG